MILMDGKALAKEIRQWLAEYNRKQKRADRRIDDYTFINFAELILGNPEAAAENIARIRSGDELRFHFLWRRKDESERFGIADDGKEVLNRKV